MKKRGHDARSVDRHGGNGNGKRGMAWPAPWQVHGFGGRGYRHRRGRYGRRRRLHEPRLSGQGHSFGLCDPLAVDRRRHRRLVRRLFLQRARRDVSALERGVQFPEPRLSSGVRISGGLGVGDGRLRGAGGPGRDGLRGIWQVGISRRSAARACGWRGLAGVDRAAQRRQALLDLSTGLDDPEGRADRCLPDCGICRRHAAAGLVCAARFRRRLCHQRAVRDRPRVRDVFVLRVECRDLHHRRDARRRSRACRVRCWRER